MPIKVDENDDGGDAKITPARRESDTSDQRPFADILGRIASGASTVPGQPEMLDISEFLARLEEIGISLTNGGVRILYITEDRGNDNAIGANLDGDGNTHDKTLN